MSGINRPRTTKPLLPCITAQIIALLLIGCDDGSNTQTNSPPVHSEPIVFSAGPDFEVVPIDWHVTKTKHPNFQVTEWKAYPADGYQLVIVYPKNARDRVSLSETHLIVWAGQHAMLSLGQSKLSSREETGYLFIGPAGSRDYRVMLVAPHSDHVGLSTTLIGRSVPGKTLYRSGSRTHAIHILMHGPFAKDPAVLDALEAIATGQSSLMESEGSASQTDRRSTVRTRAMSAQDSYRHRAQCATALWLLSDGDRFGPLSAILEEQHRRVATEGPEYAPSPGKMYDYELRETSLLNPIVQAEDRLALGEMKGEVEKLEKLYRSVNNDVSFIYPPIVGGYPSNRTNFPLHPFMHTLGQLKNKDDLDQLLVQMVKSDIEPVSLMAGESLQKRLVKELSRGFYGWRSRESILERASQNAEHAPTEAQNRLMIEQLRTKRVIEQLEYLMAVIEQAPNKRATRIVVHRVRENVRGIQKKDQPTGPFGPDQFPLILKHWQADPAIQKISVMLEKFDQWAEAHPLTEEDRQMANAGQGWYSSMPDPAQ